MSLMTATEFLNIFDCEGYAEAETGDELECVIKDSLSSHYNTVFSTFEYLTLPKVEATEIAALDYSECITFEEVIEYLTDYYNETHETQDSEFVSTVTHCNKPYGVLLSHIDNVAADNLETKCYDFSHNDKTLAYGYASAYNKRCSCSYIIRKPAPNYGEAHNYQLYVVGSEFIDAACADYDDTSYHFNTREVSKLVAEVNRLRREYNDNDCL